MRFGAGAPAYSEAELETIERGWRREGLSAREIALQLPGRTRNGIIGIIHRKGWSERPPLGFVRAQVVRQTPPTKRPAPPPRPLPLALPQPRPSPLTPPALAVVTAPTPEGSRTLLDLGFGDCRFPLPGPTGADQPFCSGQAVGTGSWCAAHARLVFNPAAPRRPKPDDRSTERRFR